MIFKDALVAGVSRNKFNELVVKIKVKEEDYLISDYEGLRSYWQEGVTRDVIIVEAEATTLQVDAGTGEVL